MADEEVPPLVLGEGSPKSTSVPASVVGGHMCVIGTKAGTDACIADLVTWAAKLGAGNLVVDLEGDVTALLVDRAVRGQLAPTELRILTPSSPVGIPVALKPLSGLSSAPHTEVWARIRTWLPPLLATLAGMGPGTPDHQGISDYFRSILDGAKERNPSILTVQGLAEEVRSALAAEGSPLTAEVAAAVGQELSDLAEDLRNAALAYGAPVDLPKLISTPLHGEVETPGTAPPHIDVLLLDHMTSVADRNGMITALLLEVFGWCQLHGREGRLMVVLPEVESPTAFIQIRPFTQRLSTHVLDTSQGTGLLGVVVPVNLEDLPGMPRFGVVLLEKGEMERNQAVVQSVLADQGMTDEAWQRMNMLLDTEWALAAGEGWKRWYRFTPSDEAIQKRELSSEALQTLLPPEVRDVLKRRPELEEEEEETEEGAKDEGGKETAKAARAVEDVEDLLSYTERRPAKRTEAKVHREVQELLRRKLEEKERAKEAQKFELTEIDLVEGEEPEAPPPMEAQGKRPLSAGVIDDTRGVTGEGTGPSVELHSDDLTAELAALEAREREERAMRGEEELVVDLTHGPEDWEDLSVEEALGTEGPTEERRQKREVDEDEGEEDVYIDIDE